MCVCRTNMVANAIIGCYSKCNNEDKVFACAVSWRTAETAAGDGMSEIRKRYVFRLVARCVIFVLCAVLWVLWPQGYGILDGMNFFKELSIFHVLWVIWVIDMILQIVPIKNKVALGSQKLFANRFRPIREKIDMQHLRDYVTSTTKSAYLVMLLCACSSP